MRSRFLSRITPMIVSSALILCSFTTPGSIGPNTIDSFGAETAVYLNGRSIITWKENTPLYEQEFLLNNCNFEIEYSDPDFSIGTFADSDSFNAAKESPYVLSVEADSPLEAQSLTDDPFSSTQWWLENTGTYTKADPSGSSYKITSTADIDIDAEEGWPLYKSSIGGAHEVTVAIIDTGIDYRHEDLKDAMWINEGEIPDNGIDDDHNGYVDDIYGWDFYNDEASVCHYVENGDGSYSADPNDRDDHGTHIAGIIVARANNQTAISGIARYLHTRVMALKIHGGPDRKGSVSDAVKAIRYAQSKGASVCNISWGSYTASSALETAIKRSTMLFVCAAGNYGNDNDITPLYPASFDLPNIISVAYVDSDGLLPSDSCFGATSVDLAAPSTDIYSTIVGSCGYMSGSSMAAPMVSAVSAILFSLRNNLTPISVKDVILRNTKPLDSLAGKCVSGGLLNLYRCMKAKDDLVRDKEAPTFTWTRSFTDGNIVLNFDATDGEDGSGVNSMFYMLGKREPSDFARGTEGTLIENNTLVLQKGGKHTIYVYDNTGNASTVTIPVIDDKLPPRITDVSFVVNNKRNKFTVTAKVSDNQSGLKSIKYLPGQCGVADFSSGGTVLKPDSDNIISFKTTKPGIYTILATDNRGNKALETVRTYVRTAQSITLSDSTLMLSVGDTFLINTSLSPNYSTDTVYFRSADEDVAAVTNSGKVTARGIGTTTITATATGGATATCTVTVNTFG
ncbi:MAG: S8 family serine peptidase [Lachnospiraceae bacterium]|nr:S8 family serine peptidase [Lachnospiraceae bacterium]